MNLYCARQGSGNDCQLLYDIYDGSTWSGDAPIASHASNSNYSPAL